MHVRISRATDTVWEGEVLSISAKNTEGPFDILPMHAHFISIIEENPIHLEKQDGTSAEYVFKRSVMHVKDDMVNIYADIL